MHACLNVDEILRLIACELITSKGRAAAVALACCCKSFEDPVLDVLWETQNRLTPLLNSLPGGVRNKCRRAVSAPTTYVFSPSIVSFLSLSKDSRQPWNGPASGSTLEGCEVSQNGKS